MALTVVPDDSGTLWVARPGSEEIELAPEDVDRLNLTDGEKAFLKSMFRYAVPGPVSCAVPNYPPEDMA